MRAIALLAAPARAVDIEKKFEGFEGCLLVRDVDKDVTHERFGGDLCAERAPACSTFKLPLALMAFDLGDLEESTRFK